MDKLHDWFLSVKDWATCCSRVLPGILWEDIVHEPSIVPIRNGRVCYTAFLVRHQLRFHNKLGRHAGFRRRLSKDLFASLLRADRTLRETLDLVDPNKDGFVSTEEFAGVLARFGRVISPEQVQLFYRTTIAAQGSVCVEDFLGQLSVQFSFAHARPTSTEDAFVPSRLDAICRELLANAAADQSVAVTLRVFFEKTDTNGNGYVESEELVSALRTLKSCSGLTDTHLHAIFRFMDLDENGRINYPELLTALSVEHCPSQTDHAGKRCPGPKALLNDVLEAVYHVLHFEYAKPLRALLRRVCPPGCTRCTPDKFATTLGIVNRCAGQLLSEAQLLCLVNSLDVDEGLFSEGDFDFDDFFDSFQIVDTERADLELSGSEID